jgi:hypothetical protein
MRGFQSHFDVQGLTLQHAIRKTVSEPARPTSPVHGGEPEFLPLFSKGGRGEIQVFLEKFVQIDMLKRLTAKQQQEVLRGPTGGVVSALADRTPREKFLNIVNRNGWESSLTGLLLLDFSHGEEEELQELVKKFGGVSHLKRKEFDASVEVIDPFFDMEDYGLYAAFPNPMACFDCATSAMSEMESL